MVVCRQHRIFYGALDNDLEARGTEIVVRDEGDDPQHPWLNEVNSQSLQYANRSPSVGVENPGRTDADGSQPRRAPTLRYHQPVADGTRNPAGNTIPEVPSPEIRQCNKP